MEFLALVPVLFIFLGVLYFAACLIVDHEIRSAEKKFGYVEGMPAGSGGQSPEVSVGFGEAVFETSSAAAAGESTGRTRGGSGAIGGWAGRRLR